MGDPRLRYGVVIGLAGAAIVLALGGSWPSVTPEGPARYGPVLSDQHGALREIVIQYVPETAAIVEETYRSFLRQLPPEVVVYAVCPDRAAFEDLELRLGAPRGRLQPILAGHPMTTWSRDRWLALAPAPGRDTITLLSPRVEDGQAVWPERAGDRRIGDDLGASLDHVASHRSRLAFDGGDFVSDEATVFVTPRVVRRNVPARVPSRDALATALERRLGKRIVLFDEAPDHHAGMFMMLVGNRTAIVGDPSLARALVPDVAPTVPYDFSPQTQRLFDAVATRCRAEGYRVVRMPVLPGADGRTYQTPLNGLLDERGGRTIVYFPTYAHAPALEARATEVWRRLGLTPRPVDCTHTYQHFGSLRCLVNVLRRG